MVFVVWWDRARRRMHPMTKPLLLALLVLTAGCDPDSGVPQSVVDEHMKAAERLLQINQALRDSTAWYVRTCDSLHKECEAKFWECADLNELLIDEATRRNARLSRLAADSARCAEGRLFTMAEKGTIDSVFIGGRWFAPCDTTRKGE